MHLEAAEAAAPAAQVMDEEARAIIKEGLADESACFRMTSYISRPRSHGKSKKKPRFCFP